MYKLNSNIVIRRSLSEGNCLHISYNERCTEVDCRVLAAARYKDLLVVLTDHMVVVGSGSIVSIHKAAQRWLRLRTGHSITGHAAIVTGAVSMVTLGRGCVGESIHGERAQSGRHLCWEDHPIHGKGRQVGGSVGHERVGRLWPVQEAGKTTTTTTCTYFSSTRWANMTKHHVRQLNCIARSNTVEPLHAVTPWIRPPL